MSRFYACALDQRLSGSLAYLESVQRIFAQDNSTGVIEVSTPDGMDWVVLYQAGKPFVAYQFKEDQHSLEIDLAAVDAAWRGFPPGAELRIRYLELPGQALRSAWQMLDWGAPLRCAEMECRSLPGYLDALNVEGTHGLLRIVLPEYDGFILFVDGSPVNTENIFATPRGFVDKLPNLRGEITLVHRNCQISLYEIAPGTLTARLLALRLACIHWVRGSITNYQQLVGLNLVNSMNYAVNTCLRLKHLNLHLVNATLVDNEIFLKQEDAAKAYRLLLETALENMALVVGDALARRGFDDAYRRLKPPGQQVLDGHKLSPAALGMV